MGPMLKTLGSVTVMGTDSRFSHCTYIPDVTITFRGSNLPSAVIVTGAVLAVPSTVASDVAVAPVVPVGVAVAVAVIVGVAPAGTGVGDDGTVEDVAAAGVVAGAVGVMITGLSVAVAVAMDIVVGVMAVGVLVGTIVGVADAARMVATVEAVLDAAGVAVADAAGVAVAAIVGVGLTLGALVGVGAAITSSTPSRSALLKVY